jgi:hypothetical protein
MMDRHMLMGPRQYQPTQAAAHAAVIALYPKSVPMGSVSDQTWTLYGLVVAEAWSPAVGEWWVRIMQARRTPKKGLWPC